MARVSSAPLPVDALLIPSDVIDVLAAAVAVASVPSQRNIMRSENVLIPTDLVAELIVALEDAFPGIVRERQRVR